MNENLLGDGAVIVPINDLDEGARIAAVALTDAAHDNLGSDSHLSRDDFAVHYYDDFLNGNLGRAVTKQSPVPNDLVFHRNGSPALILDIREVPQIASAIPNIADLRKKLSRIVLKPNDAVTVAVIEGTSPAESPVTVRLELPSLKDRVFPRDHSGQSRFLSELSSFVHAKTGEAVAFKIGQTTTLHADVSTGSGISTDTPVSRFTTTLVVPSNFGGVGRKNWLGRGIISVAHGLRGSLNEDPIRIRSHAKGSASGLDCGEVIDHRFSFQSSPRYPDAVDAAFISVNDQHSISDLNGIRITSVRAPRKTDRGRAVQIFNSTRDFQTAELLEPVIADAQFIDEDYFKPRYINAFSLMSPSRNRQGHRVPVSWKGDSGSLVCIREENGAFTAIGMVIAGGNRSASDRYPLTYGLPLPEALVALDLYGAIKLEKL
ncbi:hypothetical protein GR248_24335 [Rhizobium leguminosarum]|uniref:hypothetical protein n=1 Tax=Rhizobium leguminosarum TaxID=384 RepID=UPI0013C9F76B|nr:hypothetical protein [Rhizobium leguminosarum]NEI93929.1 hypothetical protein [Rhizobium leguminosarum]